MSDDANFANAYALVSRVGQTQYAMRYYKKDDRFYVGIKDLYANGLIARIALDKPHSPEVDAIILELTRGPVAERPISDISGSVRILPPPSVVVKPAALIPAVKPSDTESLPQIYPMIHRRVQNLRARPLAPETWLPPRLFGNKPLGEGGFGAAELIDMGFTQTVKKIGEISEFEENVLPYLKHPNIVKAARGVIMIGEKQQMMMDMAPGIRFSDYKKLVKSGKAPRQGPSAYEHWKEQWVSLKAYLNRLGIQHNDLNEKNVMIVPETYDFVVIDWGAGTVDIPFGEKKIVIPWKNSAAAARFDWAYINYYYVYIAELTGVIAREPWIEQYRISCELAAGIAFVWPRTNHTRAEFKPGLAGDIEYGEWLRGYDMFMNDYRMFRQNIQFTMDLYKTLTPQKKEVLLAATFQKEGWLYPAGAQRPAPPPMILQSAIMSSSSSALPQRPAPLQPRFAGQGPVVYVNDVPFTVDDFTTVGELETKVQDRMPRALPVSERWVLQTLTGEKLIQQNATLKDMGIPLYAKLKILPIL